MYALPPVSFLLSYNREMLLFCPHTLFALFRVDENENRVYTKPRLLLIAERSRNESIHGTRVFFLFLLEIVPISLVPTIIRDEWNPKFR